MKKKARNLGKRVTYLKVAAAEEKVDFGAVKFFVVLEGSVDIVEVAMHTTFYCDFHSDFQIRATSWSAGNPTQYWGLSKASLWVLFTAFFKTDFCPILRWIEF